MDDQLRITPRIRLFRFLQRNFVPVFVIILVIVLGLVYEAGRYSVYQAHPELSGQEQAATILQNVGKLIRLPQDETPTMATINDATTAKKSQPFLTNAANGDILIIYSNTGEALLYRPSTDQLIAVGPVDNSGAALAAPAPTQMAATSTENATTTKTRK